MAKRCWPIDGQQLASNYDVFFDKIVEVGDVKVALVDVGDGGNQCGPAKVIVWKPEGGDDPEHHGRTGRMRRAAGGGVRQRHLFRALSAAGRIASRRCNGRRPTG